MLLIICIFLSMILLPAGVFFFLQTEFLSILNDYYLTAKKSFLTPLGLSSLLYLAWAVLLIIMTRKQPRFIIRHINIVISSLIILIASTGILGFFEPWNGILGYFTLDGQISLGGSIGSLIITENNWMGSLILGVLIILAVSLSFPLTTFKLMKSLYKFAVFSTIFAITSSRSVQVYVKCSFKKISRANFPNHTLVTQDKKSSQEKISKSNFELFYKNTAEKNSGIFSKTLNSLKIKSSNSLINRPQTKIESQTSNSVLQENLSSIISNSEVSKESQSETIERFPSRKNQPENLQSTEPKYNKFWNIGTESIGDPTTTTIPTVTNDLEFDNDSPITAEQNHPALNEALKTRISQHWDLPNINTLKTRSQGGITQSEIDATATTIRDTLTHNGIDVEMGLISPGPTVTMYGLEPGWVVKSRRTGQKDENGQPIFEEDRTRVTVDTILKRERDLALALKTNRIRIESPALGRSLVGIEVPNPAPSVVSIRSILESSEFEKIRPKSGLPIALGKGTGGDTIVTDLTQMPHLLIAGATGSGKSILLNTLVSCLLMEKSPEELRLILIDPKRVELTPYNGVPHLLSPAIVEVDKVVGTLRGVANEMMKRYRTFETSGVRNIESYNKQSSEKMPMLVVVIDELADLMMTASADVERVLCRLAQMGRATGIHLIIATQRPSVNVLTGLIKANFPTRISFTVTSQVDSRTILDATGAEKLLGKGDMLYLPSDAMQPIRAQGTFISEEEIASIVLFWKTVKSGPMQQINLDSGEPVDNLANDHSFEDTDELFKNAVDLGNSNSKLSTSLLQRKLRIGYPRAARLMDQLEDKGIVGPSDGSKSRDVII